jgi:multisubunit Na+/H+ antiporter MnhC subunit
MEKKFSLISKRRLNKKGQTGGLITGLIFGVASLVIGVIIALVIVSTLNDASLLTAGSTEQGAVDNLTANFTEGIDKVSDKIPTVLLVAAIVLILGVLAILVGVWQRMRMGGGSTL